MKPIDIDDFVVWCAVGIILGGRVGYVLFYDLPLFMANRSRFSRSGTAACRSMAASSVRCWRW
jgi:prolipoprotein diacylglyceryltransferase